MSEVNWREDKREGILYWIGSIIPGTTETFILKFTGGKKTMLKLINGKPKKYSEYI